MKLQFWDTAGQEKFRSVAKGYFRNANGCIVVYDVNNRLSFKSTQFWIDQFESGSKVYDSSCPIKPILVLGNKTDMDVKYKQISKEELESFAEDHSVMIDEVSAKKNSGRQVHRAIDMLVENLIMACKQMILNSRICKDLESNLRKIMFLESKRRAKLQKLALRFEF